MNSTGPAYVAPRPPKRRRIGLIGGLIIGAVSGITAIIVLAVVLGEPRTLPNQAPQIEGRQLAVASATAPTTSQSPIVVTPAPGEFTVTLTTVSKKCFGSAGCNVVVEPQLTYMGTSSSLVDGCDVTYTVSGDDSGEVIATAYNASGLDFRVSRTVLSTKNSGVKPTATVTGVTCR